MKNFAEQILNRYKSHARDLPWRHTKDPYKIWLSEVIMQQTQISQGTSYYLTFIENFPTVKDLAKAEEQEILVLWQGLGYYSRARNLHFTAKEIVNKYNGNFPDNFRDLLKLKGVGEYTASAVSSICYGEVRPAIDGNVMRVISRLFEIYEPVNTSSGKKKIKQITEQLISKKDPGNFNQALMDFGSQVCKAKNPDCSACIFSDKCLAYKNSVIHKLPFKNKAKKKEKVYLSYFICVSTVHRSIIIRKRTKGIWKNLYELPKIRGDSGDNDKSLIDKFITNYNLKKPVTVKDHSAEIKHVLSHKELYIKFFLLDISETDFKEIIYESSFKEIKISKLIEIPFPIIIRTYLDKKFAIV